MKSIILFVCFSVLCTLASAKETCERPKKIVEFQWTGLNVPLYFPLGHRNDTNMMKELLYGSTLNPDEDLTKLCPRLILNMTHAQYVGVNKTLANYNVGPRLDGKFWSYNVTYEGKNTDFNYEVHVPLSDGKTFALVVRCWGNGLRGWTVISTKKFLHDDVQLEILEFVKSLGFDTADTLPLRYKSCPELS